MVEYHVEDRLPILGDFSSDVAVYLWRNDSESSVSQVGLGKMDLADMRYWWSKFFAFNFKTSEPLAIARGFRYIETWR